MQSSRILGTFAASVLAAAIMLSTAAPASAQSYNYGGPGAANVSVANGGVEIIRADSGAQVPATINATLVPGDYLATASGANAEVQFDGATMLRLAGSTQVRFVNMSPGSREAQLATGTADIAVLQGSGGAQLDTPSLSVRQNQSGDTRVTVLGNGETLVTVRSGSATVSDANGSQTLTPGTTLAANGSNVWTQNSLAFDGFDQFNIARDQAAASAYNANPYLSPYLAGYSNLASCGQWQNVPGYGYAWAPGNQSQNNFAPYQNGQWVWEPGYGYTWVDNSQCGGYTTSHYGTWFNNPNYGGWLWQPPSYQNQLTASSLASGWLPAVVSLFLTNGGGGLSSLLGNLSGLLGGNDANAMIGWIPLAPGEQYAPWYSSGYVYPQTSVVPVTNVTNVYNYYSNARYYRGVQAVPVSAWRSGNFHAIRPVRATQIRQMALIRGAVPVVPTTANLRYTTARVNHPVTLARAFSAPRLASHAPSTAPLSFSAQQSKVRSIVSVRPHVVALPARHAPASHPVYQPVKHAAVHVTVMKPVAHSTTKAVMRHAAPTTVHHAAPVTVHHAAPVTVHHAAPVTAHHAAPAVTHHVAPAPAVHHVAPAPVVHHATPAVMHHAAPLHETKKSSSKPSPAPHGHP